MNWEVIFLDGREGRPYRECKICRALKGLIEEVEPVAVFVPEGEKEKVLDILKGIPPESLEEKLKELYESWGVDNFERKIDEELVWLYLYFEYYFEFRDFNNTCETCIFHCEKRNKIWRKNDKWNSNLLSIFQSRVDEKVNGARTKCVFDFSIFPDVSFKGKVFPEEARFIFSEFLGESNFGESEFKSANFWGAKFENADFRKVKFKSADFTGAEFKFANFIVAKFESANFTGAKFKFARFMRAKFESANFYDAKFESANFWHADFESADFTGAEFENTVKLFPIRNCFSFDFTRVKFGEKCEVLIRNLRSAFLSLNNIDNIPEKFTVYDLKILSHEEFIHRFSCGKEFKVKIKKARDRAEKVKNINRVKRSINGSLRKTNSFWKDWKKKLHEYENRANLEIVDLELGNKTKFVNCDFSGAERIRIEDSDLTDVRFLATDWGDINEKRICPELFEKEPKKARDIYRQLKLTLDNHKDFVSANGFYALEMKAQEKILEQSMGIYREGEGIFNELKSFLRLIRNFGILPKSKYELLVLKIHRISSNFGQSWVRPFVGLYFLSLIFSLCFHFDEWSNLIKVNYLNFADSSLKVMDFVIGLKVFCCKLLTAFSIPLQMVAEITKVVKGEFNDSNPVVVASRLLYTVVAGFLIYQFGGAVRRRVKR